jgi:ribosome-binding factor A
METKRQKRIAKLLQQDLAEILQGEIRRAGVKNFLVSVTKTYVTPDLSLARVYVSIFPPEKAKESLEALRQNAKLVKHAVAQRVRHQLRKMPDLEFYLDDTLDYIEEIDKALARDKKKNRDGDSPTD